MLDHSTEIFIKAKSYQIFLFSSEIKMISNIRTFFYINKQTKRYDGPAIALVFSKLPPISENVNIFLVYGMCEKEHIRTIIAF